VKKQSRKDPIKCHIYRKFTIWNFFHVIKRRRQTSCITWEKSHKKNSKYSKENVLALIWFLIVREQIVPGSVDIKTEAKRWQINAKMK
jgi:hypothetical protein